MTQNALDAYALANGYGKMTKDMTEAEKVALRYAFVQKQLAAATGDFARTSGSWANQVRVLSLQFDSLKATIGQGLINLFTPIIRVVNTLIGKLITLANAFKAFTELITGKKSSSAAASTKAIADAAGSAAAGYNSAAGAATGAGKAAKKAAKEMKALMGFDQINKLQEPVTSGGSGGSGGGGGGGAGMDFGELAQGETVVDDLGDKFDETMSKIRKAIQPTIDAFQRLGKALEPLKNFAGQALVDFYEDFLKPVGKWTFGEAIPDLVDALINFIQKVKWSKINAALERFWRALAPFATAVGDGLIAFFKDLLSVGADFINLVVPGGLNGIAAALERIDPKVAEAIGYGLGVFATSVAAIKISKGLISRITGLGETIKNMPKSTKLALAVSFAFSCVGWAADIWQDIFSGAKDGSLSDALSMMWDDLCSGNFKFRLPLGIELPSFNDAPWLKDAIDDIASAVNAIFADITDSLAAPFVGWWDRTGKDLFAGLQEDFDTLLTPFKNGFDAIKDVFSGAPEWFGEKFGLACAAAQGAFDDIGGWFSSRYKDVTGAFKDAGSWFKGKFDTAQKGVKNAFSTIGSWFRSRYKDVTGAFSSVGNWFGERFAGAYSKVKGAFSGVGSFFAGAWKNIKGAFGSVSSWFKDKFSAAWTAVKNVFSKGGKVFDGIKDGILNGLKSVINALIGGINKVIAMPFNGLNSAIRKLKGVNILGGKPFDFLNEFKVPQIPPLAQGGYVRKNTPQLAMIGDNRHQGEVVAPEDKLREMALEAVKMAGGGAGDAEIISLLKQIIILLKDMSRDVYLDAKKVTKIVKDLINQETTMTGQCPIKILP